jgi:hypothetical protein
MFRISPYNSIVNDTHPAIERKWIEMLRAAGPSRRVAMACALTDQVIRLSKSAIKRANPEISEREIDLLFIELHYGRDLAQQVQSKLSRRASG